LAQNIGVLRQFVDAYPATQNDIARKLGINYTNFSRKLNGERKFTIEEALKLAELLQINYTDFKQIWGNDLKNYD
jgi:antitoxin component HigA of HigAB toxin-antitoxin module